MKGDCALAKLSSGGLTIGIALYDALLTDLAVIGEDALGRPDGCVPFVVAVCIDVDAVGDPTILGDGKGRYTSADHSNQTRRLLPSVRRKMWTSSSDRGGRYNGSCKTDLSIINVV